MQQPLKFQLGSFNKAATDKLSLRWITTVPSSQEPPDGTRSQGCSLLPLDRPVAFEHEVEFEPQPSLKPHSRQGSGVQYNAKVCRATLVLSAELYRLIAAVHS